MSVELPYKLPAIESVLHPERQQTGVDVDETDMQKNTTYKCGACLDFPLFPVILAIPHTECYHVFCESCLKSADENRTLSADEHEEFLATGTRPQPRCPVCRLEYLPHQVVPASKWTLPLRRQWDMVAITCPLDCTTSLTATTFQEHVKKICSRRVVKCPGILLSLQFTLLFLFLNLNYSN